MLFFSLFFFNDTATPEIYTLSLHDALPIFDGVGQLGERVGIFAAQDDELEPLDESRVVIARPRFVERDRKSTRLNSSHANISYAVFCLKKKKKKCSQRSITRCYQQWRTRSV